MLVQVVHCHPLTDSFDHALYDIILDALQQAGHTAIGTDLYREGFQPAMTEQERRTYMSNAYDNSAVESYCRTLRKVDGVIFCFPHWFYSMPAMLKGYVDRVWAPGTAFAYDPDDNHLEPSLRNIRLFGVVTSYGSPWWIVRFFAGNAGRNVMMRGLKPLCARGVRSFWLAHYDMDHSTEQSRAAFIVQVRHRIGQIR